MITNRQIQSNRYEEGLFYAFFSFELFDIPKRHLDMSCDWIKYVTSYVRIHFSSSISFSGFSSY